MSDSKRDGLALSLVKATDFLSRALLTSPSEIQRAAAIQGFEFSFELGWKLLQERLREEGVAVATPRATLRAAGDAGLIDSVERWLDYLEARNLTSHTYNERVAERVYGIIAGGFLDDVRLLLQ